jgi:ankyrin repeat protein
MFGRNKGQSELDAAFLEAVGKHKFKKAKELLKAGADVMAVDAEGNTALHKLAVADPFKGEAYEEFKTQEYNGLRGSYDKWRETLNPQIVTDFIRFLLDLDHRLDINVRNDYGQTCLHLVAGTVYERENVYVYKSKRNKATSNEYIARILLELGADISLKDYADRTVAHMAAGTGREDIVNFYLTKEPSLIAGLDQDHFLPHNYAADAANHILSRQLRNKYEAYQAAEAAKVADEVEIVPVKKPIPAAADKSWSLNNPHQVTHISEIPGYKLTEVFNFSARTCVKIVQNLGTKSEAIETKNFDDFSDKASLLEAYAALTRLGGKADENAVHGAVLPGKSEPKPRRQAGPAY